MPSAAPSRANRTRPATPREHVRIPRLRRYSPLRKKRIRRKCSIRETGLLLSRLIEGFDRLNNGGILRPAPEKINLPLGFVALGKIDAIVHPARFLAGMCRGGNQAADAEHVLQLPSGGHAIR